jgi:hypothetical protein
MTHVVANRTTEMENYMSNNNDNPYARTRFERLKDASPEMTAILFDVMRKGTFAEQRDQEDHTVWWCNHRKEINFAVRVLAGLGLLTGRFVSEEEPAVKFTKESPYEDDYDDEATFVLWYSARPTEALTRLYHDALPRYLRDRDNYLMDYFHRHKLWGGPEHTVGGPEYKRVSA